MNGMNGYTDEERDAPHKDEAREGLAFDLKDALALCIAFFQVIAARAIIAIGAFALVIYLLGKFWLKCW